MVVKCYTAEHTSKGVLKCGVYKAAPPIYTWESIVSWATWRFTHAPQDRLTVYSPVLPYAVDAAGRLTTVFFKACTLYGGRYPAQPS